MNPLRRNRLFLQRIYTHSLEGSLDLLSSWRVCRSRDDAPTREQIRDMCIIFVDTLSDDTITVLDTFGNNQTSLTLDYLYQYVCTRFDILNAGALHTDLFTKNKFRAIKKEVFINHLLLVVCKHIDIEVKADVLLRSLISYVAECEYTNIFRL